MKLITLILVVLAAPAWAGIPLCTYQVAIRYLPSDIPIFQKTVVVLDRPDEIVEALRESQLKEEHIEWFLGNYQKLREHLGNKTYLEAVPHAHQMAGLLRALLHQRREVLDKHYFSLRYTLRQIIGPANGEALWRLMTTSPDFVERARAKAAASTDEGEKDINSMIAGAVADMQPLRNSTVTLSENTVSLLQHIIALIERGGGRVPDEVRAEYRELSMELMDLWLRVNNIPYRTENRAGKKGDATVPRYVLLPHDDDKIPSPLQVVHGLARKKVHLVLDPDESGISGGHFQSGVEEIVVGVGFVLGGGHSQILNHEARHWRADELRDQSVPSILWGNSRILSDRPGGERAVLPGNTRGRIYSTYISNEELSTYSTDERAVATEVLKLDPDGGLMPSVATTLRYTTAGVRQWKIAKQIIATEREVVQPVVRKYFKAFQKGEKIGWTTFNFKSVHPRGFDLPDDPPTSHPIPAFVTGPRSTDGTVPDLIAIEIESAGVDQPAQAKVYLLNGPVMSVKVWIDPKDVALAEKFVAASVSGRWPNEVQEIGQILKRVMEDSLSLERLASKQKDEMNVAVDFAEDFNLSPTREGLLNLQSAIRRVQAIPLRPGSRLILAP